MWYDDLRMMRIKNLLLPVALTLLLVLTACNFPLANRPEEDEEDALATAVAQTVAVLATPTLPESALPTPQAGEPLQPTKETPGSTPGAPNPATDTLPCNRALFVGETIPDDTEFDGGQAFTKSWTLKNDGTCTWNTKYKLVFDSGDAMGAPASVSLTRSVAPKDQVTIEVPLKAPANPGTYTGFWRMQAEDGEKFSQVFVRIQVKSPFFAVTGVRTNLKSISPESCPYTYTVEISITANAAGTVSYKTQTGEGAETSLKSVNFDAAGTKTVKQDWSGLGEDGTTTPYELRVYIEKPNNQWFGPFRFNVTCP